MNQKQTKIETPTTMLETNPEQIKSPKLEHKLKKYTNLRFVSYKEQKTDEQGNQIPANLEVSEPESTEE